jgi:hypothetical protein
VQIQALSDMVGGWFVGDFEPHVVRSREVEVAIKRYAAGDEDRPHVHRIATEVTAIVSGSAELGGRRLEAGDIARLDPGEAAGFRALTDVVLVAVKLPSARGDKHEA